MNLLDAPHGKPLRIVDLAGGENVRRRLMALGFHKGDVVELD
ncbi:MAG: FeoA family protein, partial [Candidatus Aminicenantales bacterium]